MKIKNFKLKIILYSLLVAIILFALVIRTIGLPTNNILFLFDNARDLLYVQKMVLTHKPLLIGPSSGGLQGYFHGVFWYYLLAIPFIFGNGNPAATTLFVALLSTLSILLTFWVLRKVSNSYAAFFGATVYAFATFSVATAKFPWNPYPIVWLMPLYFLGLYGLIYRKNYALPLLAFLTSLFIHFEAIYGITLLPTLVIAAIIYWTKESNWANTKRKPLVGQTAERRNGFATHSVTFLNQLTNLVNAWVNKNKLNQFLLAIILFLIPLLPTLIFDVRHHFLITSNLLKTFTSGGQNITHSGSETPVPMNIRFNARTRDFYLYSFNVITDNFYINLLGLVMFFSGLVYFIKTVQKKKVFFICLCIITLLSPLFFFLNLKYAVWSYYWIGNAPLYILMLAYIIGEFFSFCSLSKRRGLGRGEAFRKKQKFVLTPSSSPPFNSLPLEGKLLNIKNLKFLASHVLPALFLIILLITYNPFQYLSLWQKGTLTPGPQVFSTQLQVLHTVYHDAKNQPFSVYMETPPLYDYVYRYLFSWYARTNHLQAPIDQKQKLIYVIIEPNPSDPFGNYFITHVVRTKNNPIKTFIIPGGLVIKKFITNSKELPVDPNYFPQL